MGLLSCKTSATKLALVRELMIVYTCGVQGTLWLPLDHYYYYLFTHYRAVKVTGLSVNCSVFTSLTSSARLRSPNTAAIIVTTTHEE